MNWERILRETDKPVRDRGAWEEVRNIKIGYCAKEYRVKKPERSAYKYPSLSQYVRATDGVPVESEDMRRARKRISQRVGLLYNKGVYGYLSDLTLDDMKKGK